MTANFTPGCRSAIISDFYRPGPVNASLAIELAMALILARDITTNAFARSHPHGLPRGFVEIIAGPTSWSGAGRSAHCASQLACKFLDERSAAGIDRTRARANLYHLSAAVIDANLHALIEERCA